MSSKIKRRTFLETAIKTAAVMGIGSSQVFFQKSSRAREIDLLISNGLVFDGLGTPPIKLDIAIKGGKIFRIAPRIRPDQARRVIDARGLAVSPGFIDAHSHTGIELMVNPKAESQVRQGVTTEISGNCGSSPFPIARSVFEERKRYYRDEYDLLLDWRNIDGFFSRLMKRGIGLNYATLVGHGNIRGEVVGYLDQPAGENDINMMKKILAENLKAGALGLSTGLIYPPGSYAQTEEITGLCHEVARAGGVYATHMRDEGDRILEAINETLTIAGKTGVSLQISHLKVSYPRNWPKFNRVISTLEKARARGIKLLADRYPYIAGANSLSDSLFPLWALQGSTADFIARLKDTSLDARFRHHMNQTLQKIGSWEKILISDVSSQKNSIFEGMNILEASRTAGKKPFDFIRDLLIEEQNRVGKIAFYGNEEHLKKILSHPLVVIGADGSAVAPYGTLNKGNPHPRLYGTFPRVMGHYAREEKIFTLSRAIKKMTSMTARKFNLSQRGQIREGYYADLTLFDPDTILDQSTWTEPKRYPLGITYVLVNGKPVIENGDHTGHLPGIILKHRS
jgi:N-acyl-D-amino-acid deacylase